MKDSIKISATLLALVLACSCRDDIRTECMEYEVVFNTSVESGSKGELLNTTGQTRPLQDYVSSFQISAWNTATAISAIPTGVAVTWSDGRWRTLTQYMWAGNVQKSIFAYANLPSGAGVLCNSPTGLNLSYSVPVDVSQHKDILLGAYTGLGDKGQFTIVFKHALAAIRFKEGGIVAGVHVKSVSLVGVASAGNMRLKPDATFDAWTVVRDLYDKTLTQSASPYLTVGDGGVIGEPFFVIPQDTRSRIVTVKVEMTDGSKFTTDIKTDIWTAGTVFTYDINFAG